MGSRGRRSWAEASTTSSYLAPSSKKHAASDSPSHLSPATKKWWLGIASDLEPYQLRVLTVAAEAWDRKEQARVELAANGLTFVDDRGGVRPRPEVQIEKDARIAFLRALRELRLGDIDEPDKENQIWPPVLRR